MNAKVIPMDFVELPPCRNFDLVSSALKSAAGIPISSVMNGKRISGRHVGLAVSRILNSGILEFPPLGIEIGKVLHSENMAAVNIGLYLAFLSASSDRRFADAVMNRNADCKFGFNKFSIAELCLAYSL